jgi:SET family sugar efflux transporter-like MFS transporter
VVSGALIVTVGLNETFFIAAALPAIVLVPVLFVPETRRSDAPPAPRLLPAVRLLSAQPRARAGAAALATLAAVLAFIEPLLPLDISERLDLEPVVVGAVFSAALLAYFVGAPLAGRWSDARGRRRPLLVGGIVLGASVPLIGFGPVWWVAVWMLAVGAGLAILGAGTGALLTEAVDDAGMAGAYGLSAGVLTVIFAAGYAVGPLAAAAGAAVAPFWALCIVLGVAALLASLWAWRQLAASPST